jgi:hypothetical protein
LQHCTTAVLVQPCAVDILQQNKSKDQHVTNSQCEQHESEIVYVRWLLTCSCCGDLAMQRTGKKALILDPRISGALLQLDAGLSELFSEHGISK